MWFVFLQIDGLGQGPASRKFAISSLEEATAYLRRPVLGRWLIQCGGIIAATQADRAGVDRHPDHGWRAA